MSIRQSARDRLAQYSPSNDTLRPIQIAIATYGFVLFALTTTMGNLAVKAAKQAAALARTLATLALVYGTYWLVSEMVNRPLNAAIERIIDAATRRGDLSDRAQNVLAFAIWAAVGYALYRTVRWAVTSLLEATNTPNPSQTSVDEFLDDVADDTDDDDDDRVPADHNPDHPLYGVEQ